MFEEETAHAVFKWVYKLRICVLVNPIGVSRNLFDEAIDTLGNVSSSTDEVWVLREAVETSKAPDRIR